MTPIDYILTAIVIVSMLFGAIRGFLRESVALLGWLIGLWLAWRYAPLLRAVPRRHARRHGTAGLGRADHRAAGRRCWRPG